MGTLGLPEQQVHTNCTNCADLFLWRTSLSRYTSIILEVCHNFPTYMCGSAPPNSSCCCRLHPPLLQHALSDQVNSSRSPPCMRQRVYTFSYIAAVCEPFASALPLHRTLQTVGFFIVSLQSAVQQKAGGCSGLAMLHARRSQEGATTVSCRDPHLH